MRVVFFIHSLISDWNHGNAHFLRGVLTELAIRGHEVKVFEPEDSWSVRSLLEEEGEKLEGIVSEFRLFYPGLESIRYSAALLDLDKALDGADLVIVHEWNDKEIIGRIGDHRKLNTGYRLLFHDTHHRSVTAPETMGSFDLSGYDGVLAFGEIVRSIYVRNCWAQRAWVWHEAADVRVFRPIPDLDGEGDIVWIGNWGDEERSEELDRYLFSPVNDLGLKCRIYGVRYPEKALSVLREKGIEYGGWTPNYLVPRIFSGFLMTVHIPRRPYVRALPGIPTIRVFEALSCCIPLICSPWEDCEGLFRAGKDYLLARDSNDMKEKMKLLINDRDAAMEIALTGLETVLKRHTCVHRVDELLRICGELGINKEAVAKGEKNGCKRA